MLTVFLIGALCATVWAGVLYCNPFPACNRCRGNRTVMRGTKRKPRPVTCPACKGTGRRQRPGSRTVHRLARRVQKYRERQRRDRQRQQPNPIEPEEI